MKAVLPYALALVPIAVAALMVHDAGQRKAAWERDHHCAVNATTEPRPYETSPRIETLTCDGGVKAWRYAR